jgi:hypothetical protein
MKHIITIALIALGSLPALSQTLPCPHFICVADVSPTLYAVANNPGSTYQWTVTGGTINTGQGTNTIQINWAAVPGNYQVSVVETDANGCLGTPVQCSVTINPSPVTGIITHD